MFCIPPFFPGTRITYFILPRWRSPSSPSSQLHRRPMPLHATSTPTLGLAVYASHSQSWYVSTLTSVRAQKMQRPHEPGTWVSVFPQNAHDPFGSGSFLCFLLQSPKCLLVDTNLSDTAPHPCLCCAHSSSTPSQAPSTPAGLSGECTSTKASPQVG